MKKFTLIFSFLLLMFFSAGLLRADSGGGNNTGDDSFVIGKKLDINIGKLVDNGFDPAKGSFDLNFFSNDISNDYTSHTVARYENGALVIIDDKLPVPRYLADFSSHQRPNCSYSNTDGVKAAWGGFYVKFKDKIFTLGSFSPHDPPGYVYVTEAVTETCGDKVIRYKKGWNLAGGKIAEVPLSLSTFPGL